MAALRHSEVTAAKAKGQAEGQKDNLVGNVKEGAGKLTGNKETEAKVGVLNCYPVAPFCSLILIRTEHPVAAGQGSGRQGLYTEEGQLLGCSDQFIATHM